MVKATSSGHVKETAHKLVTSDMPLYFPCPCRSSKPLMAQMMRVFVVTPDSPVVVTLNPRVQPSAPPCPVFYPGVNAGVSLPPGSFCVLRLPYVYVSEEGPILPPSDSQPLLSCRVLKGMFSSMGHVQDIARSNVMEGKRWRFEPHLRMWTVQRSEWCVRQKGERALNSDTSANLLLSDESWTLRCNFHCWTSNKKVSFTRCKLLTFEWKLYYLPFTRNIVHSSHLKNCYTCVTYNPGQKSLRHVTKCQPVEQYSLPLPLRQSSVRIVALLWTNQHQYWVGGFEVEVW